MSITVNIKGTVIEFPTSGESPDWAPAMVTFAKAVEGALNAAISTYDVAPQIQNIDPYNPTSSEVEMPSLFFPVSEVRAITIFYSVYRKTTITELVEMGQLELNYDNTRSAGSKWEIVRGGAGDAKMTFIMHDNGQMFFTTEAISGINHSGIISFRALSVLNN